MKVAFHKGRKRLFDRVVSWWLRGPYAHCELVTHIDEWGIAYCISSSFLDGGVRTKYMVLNPEHWDLIDVGEPAVSISDWCLDHLGKPYDVRGLLGFIWRRERGSQRKWFCSEAVADMLGFPQPWRFDPVSLHAALSRK